MTPAAIHYPIARIVEGPRFRQHVGDLTALAASMAALGLLHPIVITPDSHLIAGARRLAAAKQLGWTAIAVRVVDTADLLRCEHDENELRKDFTVPERVKIGMALEKEIAERNAQKQREAGKEGGRGHRKETSGEILPEGFDDHPTRNEVGRAIGMSGKTYQKARAIFQAAEEDPERYQGLAEHMELTGKVDKAYKQLQASRRQDATAPPQPAPVPRERIADRLSKDVLEICQILDVLTSLLRERTEAAMVNLVQLSEADLARMSDLFTLSQALIGDWLTEITTLRGERA
jgi:ParB family chromosome partitioning protein